MITQGFPAQGVLRRKAARVRSVLLKAYGRPDWGDRLPAVDELVATILSQNTNDINSGRAFGQLLERFGSMEAVRDAELDDLIETIRPAGLANQKGPRIQAVLRAITAERGKLELGFLRRLPPAEARAWLTKFNGVGPKTASIVLLFALGMPAFPVDTHVHRVTGRLGLRPEKLSADDSHEWLEQLFAPETFGDAHINLIRHGREICHARNPQCEICPLQSLCDDYQRRGTHRPVLRRS
jgi:endonuclease III